MSLEDLPPKRFLALADDYLRRYALSRRAALRGALATAATVSALGSTASRGDTPRKGGTLRVGRVEEPDSLDPHKTSLAVASATMGYIYESPARRDDDGKLVPALAEGWELRDGNKTLVFHLRQGATFHDGSPCDANACVFTVKRMLDPATAAPTAYLLGAFDTIEAIDDHTVAYKFKQPFVPVWVGLTSSYCGILPPGPVQKLGAQFGRNPVGSGPFKFVSWAPDSGIKLARFDQYKAGPVPLVDALQFAQYPEDSTRVAALQSGEINAIWSGQSVPLDRVRSLKRESDIQVQQRPSLSIRALDFNESRKPLDDIRVRRAICHAVDPQRVIALALDGNANPAHGPLPSAMPGYDKKVDQLAYKYDPDQARALLKDAGVQPGTTLHLICNDSPSIRQSAEIVQAQLKDVGLTVTIQSMPIGQVVALTKKAEHDIYLYTYTYFDPDILYPAFDSKGSLNRDFVADPDMDRMIEASRVEFDDAKRQALYDTIQQKLVEEARWAPLFEPLNFAAFDSSVQGAVLRVDGEIDARKVWLKA
ncbi:MAG TPA: ABC transporter substrate-binding protein [Acetobacteraceae bacterium]|jgi:peptide/nickel transport system substrate-binding protein|nr:ABC transporter substrate-binding protein [Acetobacteraceae bacterium]